MLVQLFELLSIPDFPVDKLSFVDQLICQVRCLGIHVSELVVNVRSMTENQVTVLLAMTLLYLFCGFSSLWCTGTAYEQTWCDKGTPRLLHRVTQLC